MSNSPLSPNTLAFIALSNEYCQALEHAPETTRQEFVDNMLRLLPRLYISASDLEANTFGLDFSFLPDALDEEYYESIRRGVERIMGEDDTYLEVFEDDMKYSDTPISASISEELADMFQVFFNLLECIKDAPDEVIIDSVGIVKEDFASYWSQKLCNVMRALNTVKYNNSNPYA